MRSIRHVLFIRTVYLLVDIVAITLAFYLACLWRPQTLSFEVTWANFFSSIHNQYHLLFLIWMAIIIYFNQIHGLYRTKREIVEGFEIIEVLKSVIYALFIFLALLFLLRAGDFPRSIVILGSILCAVFLSLWRIVKKRCVEFLVSRGYNNFNAVIIGAGKVGQALAQEIHARRGMGINIVGFLDDFKTGKESKTGIPIIGNISSLESILEREFINEVFVTIHHDPKVFDEIIELSKSYKVALRVVPQGYEAASSEIIRYNIGIIPILAYLDININYSLRFKRVFDFILALGGILVLSPVLLSIMYLIKKEDGGPIFYRSRRYGHSGRVFDMLKFRSMVVNADAMLGQLKDKNEVDGPIFKMKKDPRVTKVGVILRKYSLDELPQLINVIKGDMSLVGPRPLPIEQVEREDLRQLRRLHVRPGITGLWQIRGRSDVSFDRLIRWDIWYISNWSFTLDLYILLQTIPVVLRAKGAY